MQNHSARDIRNEYRRVRGEHTTGIELYFTRGSTLAGAPVTVFQHTMKTGGTALRALIYANLSSSSDYAGYDAPKSAKHDDLGQWYRDFLGTLSGDERARLVWVAGHTAAHAVPFLGPETRLVTVVRDPVDRVVSRHWFAGRLTESGSRVERIDSLREIYESPDRVERKRHEGYSNFQSASILAPFYDVAALRASNGPGPDADLWRGRLADVTRRCALLVQDRLDDDVRRLSVQAGWQYSRLPKVRVNRERPAVADLGADLHATIAAYNWLDVELYQRAVASGTAPIVAAGQ
jgi:hypothetical protein